jgi:RimJ/RimL family protein N-acetyltransferase
MLTHSQNVALTPLDFNNYQNAPLDVLWNELTESAVEPMQAPVPDLINFAEDCLLCAIVVLRRNFTDPASGDFVPLEDEIPYEEEPIGLVYVTAAPAQSAAQEANVGIIISKCHQRKGFAREAVDLALKWAFEDLKFHRIQAAFMDDAQKDRAMRLFVGQGFTHEGTRRRSVFKPERGGVVGVWKDVTYLAMLDTEWALRHVLKPKGAVPTLWDEMFARHTREREDMVKWDEKHNRIRRVSSTDTLRDRETPRQSNRTIIDPWPSDMSSSSCQSSSYGSVPPSPNPGAAAISTVMQEYLDFGDSRPRWNPLHELDDVSRQSSPSPYDLYIPSTSIPDPPRSPSVPSSVSEFESEDESDVAPSWRALQRIPTSGASSSSSRLSWTQRPLIPINIDRPRSASGSSESGSWSDASASDNVDDPDSSDWDMMSEPERSS